MSKGGGGEIRDAKRILFKEADCVALRGYNSIIIGPSDKIYNVKSAANMADITSAEVLPDTPHVGQKIALLSDDADGHKAGNVYVYASTTSGGTTSSAWALYTGLDEAV